MRDQYLAAGIGRPEQYSRILSGFNLQPFLSAVNNLDLRRQLGISESDFVVGKIARLVALKGHDDLFAIASEVVRSCPSVKFLLVGDGYWRERFEQMARDSGIEKHFVFAGLVPPGQVPALVGIMDCLVHLSAREGLARALPQALANAKPIVTYDSDGAGEVCFDGRTGFLVASGKRELLQARILELASDPGLCAQLGQCGQEFVRSHFSVERMVDDLYDLYRALQLRRAFPAAS